MTLEAARAAVAETCRRLVAEQLVVGTAGNVSVRVGDQVAISPSGFDYLKMTAADVVVVDLAGIVVSGNWEPSSELPLHLDVYAASTHNAVVHTHAVASTALSLVVDEVPLSHYYSALFGGPIRVAGYATYGSTELAVNVQAAIKDRSGALMSNHGAVVAAASLPKAFALAQYLEYVCDIQLKAMATGLPVKLITQAQLAEVQAKLAGYGQG